MSSERSAQFYDTTPKTTERRVDEARGHKAPRLNTQLPASSVCDTAGLVYLSLTGLNAKPMSATKRARHLEAFRPSIHYVTQHLTDLFIHHALPLPKAEHNAAIMASDLYAQMTHGYKKLAADLLTTDQSGLNPQKIIAALYRATAYLYQFHLSCYQRYAPIPQTAWKELHQLYGYAEKYGLANTHVSDNEASTGHGTIAEVYKQALLVSLANPYRYAPDQIRAVAKFLERWVKRADLYQVSERHNESRLFVAMLESSEGPLPWTMCPYQPDSSWRILDTSRLVGVLREFILVSEKQKTQHTTVVADSLALRTLHRLLRTFALASQRDATRTDKTVRLWVTMGLSDTYLCINRELGHTETRSRGAIFPCILINESVGGACLVWKGDLPEKLRVGDVIGLYGDDLGGNRAQIAAVRWITNPKEGVWMLGLQRLVDNAQAVAAKLPSSETGKGRVVPGLLLTENKAANLPATLVLPTFAYRLGESISVLRRGEEFNLQFIKVVETTATFTRFVVRSCAPTTETSATPKRSSYKTASGF